MYIRIYANIHAQMLVSCTHTCIPFYVHVYAYIASLSLSHTHASIHTCVSAHKLCIHTCMCACVQTVSDFAYTCHASRLSAAHNWRKRSASLIMFCSQDKAENCW